jgi:hypothetical protein
MFYRLLLIGVLAASCGLAQGKKGGGGGMGGDSGSPMPMAMPNKFDTICNTLNLTKDQKKTVKTMLDDGAKEATPLREQLSKTRIVVADAIQNKKNDDELHSVEAASAAVAAQMTQLEMKTFAKLYSSLDDNQKANKNAVARVFQIMTGIFREKNWNEF